MKALGTWGERWMELAPEHLDPGVVLHSWVSWYLAHEQLPDRRVVVHFRFPGLPKKGAELWIIFDGEHSEVCRKDPGFEVDLYVQAEPAALAEWHSAGSNGPMPSGPNGSDCWDRRHWPGRCQPGTAGAPQPRRTACTTSPGSGYRRGRRDHCRDGTASGGVPRRPGRMTGAPRGR